MSAVRATAGILVTLILLPASLGTAAAEGFEDFSAPPPVVQEKPAPEPAEPPAPLPQPDPPPEVVVPPKPQESEQYVLKLCNEDGREIDAAIAVRSAPEDRYVTIRAWYRVAGGTCEEFGPWRFGTADSQVAYVRGDAGDVYWGDGSVQFCIADRKYTRMSSANYECLSGEYLADFTTLNITKTNEPILTFTYTFQ